MTKAIWDEKGTRQIIVPTYVPTAAEYNTRERSILQSEHSKLTKKQCVRFKLIISQTSHGPLSPLSDSVTRGEGLMLQ